MRYCVYYMDELRPQAEFFDDLLQALEYSRVIRDKGYKYVSLVSEDPDNVTKMGVSGAPIDYNWTKRR